MAQGLPLSFLEMPCSGIRFCIFRPGYIGAAYAAFAEAFSQDGQNPFERRVAAAWRFFADAEAGDAQRRLSVIVQPRNRKSRLRGYAVMGLCSAFYASA